MIQINEKLKQKIENDKLILGAKEYLNTTGWIWEKYNRVVKVLKTMTDAQFKNKYSEIIKKQQDAASLINDLEK